MFVVEQGHMWRITRVGVDRESSGLQCKSECRLQFEQAVVLEPARKTNGRLLRRPGKLDVRSNVTSNGADRLQMSRGEAVPTTSSGMPAKAPR